jgi:PAS domain S-box-containing protein
LRSLKTKYALSGAAFGLLLVVAVFAIAAVLRGSDFGLRGLALPIAVAAIAAAAWLAFTLGRRITNELEQLNRSTHRMAEGDFTQPVRTLRNDELGDLQRTVDLMRQSLADTTITKNYLDNVLNSMVDAVFVVRPDGSIRSTNVAAQRLTGTPAPELTDRQIGSLLSAPDLGEAERVQRASDTGEALLRTASGQTIPVSFSCSVLDNTDPHFRGHIYVARDITERKRAERRIRYLARYDALTKIPNRMQFQHLLQQAIARVLRARTGGSPRRPAAESSKVFEPVRAWTRPRPGGGRRGFDRPARRAGTR